MVSLTLERNAASDAQFDLFQAGSTGFYRLQINGPQIASGDNHSLVIDWSGVNEEVIPLANQDRGNNIATLVSHMIYDDTGSKALQVTCTTDVSAI